MQSVYPVFIQQDGKEYLVYIPDLDRGTQGKSFYDAIRMARDLLGTWSLDEALPAPSDPQQALRMANEKADPGLCRSSDSTLVFVDIDTDEYKRKLDTRSVKKNCTIPAWLNDKAEKAGINFSRVLQEALIERLGK